MSLLCYNLFDSFKEATLYFRYNYTRIYFF